MNGIIFCVCLTLAISVLQSVLEVMSKRTQKDAGEERVTAKSRPMMSLIARASSTLSSSASESPEKKSYKSQSAWSAKAEKNDRTGRPVVDCHKQFIESSYSARYSRKNLMIELGNPLCMLKENQGHSNSSLETTKQNQNFIGIQIILEQGE